ncbi:MAG: hypothetical protein PUA90_02920 [bacterium]|nr:hypothetical protein [bacterium]
MSEIIIAIIVVVILLCILVILFAATSRRVNVLVRNIFVDKLQEYDFLIDNKEKKIDDLNNTIDKRKKSYFKLEEEINELGKKKIDKEEIVVTDVVLPDQADFEDGNILTGYKKIKEGFNFKAEEIINKFIKEKYREDKNYNIYTKIRSYFDYNSVYKIMTYQSEEQKIIVNGLLTKNEKKLLNNLLDVKKFNIIKFLDKLDNLIMKSNPEVLIYVGDENKNYNYINSNIKTIYDKEITEGFKIIYKGVVYDYSI